jgi:hypothetical protein
MNVAAIRTGAIVLGGATLAGAVVGGGIGAVHALKHEGVDGQLSRQEGRDTFANAIIGAGIGAAAGVAVLGARSLVPVLQRVPVMGAMKPGMLVAAGGGAGAAAAGVGSLAHHALD